MNTSNELINQVKAYYSAMLRGEFELMASLVHEDIHFKSPLAEYAGKERLVSSAKGLAQDLKSITYREAFTNGDKVMIAYDFDFPAPIGLCASAGLFTLKDGLITSIELFFDTKDFG